MFSTGNGSNFVLDLISGIVRHIYLGIGTMSYLVNDKIYTAAVLNNILNRSIVRLFLSLVSGFGLVGFVVLLFGEFAGLATFDGLPLIYFIVILAYLLFPLQMFINRYLIDYFKKNHSTPEILPIDPEAAYILGLSERRTDFSFFIDRLVRTDSGRFFLQEIDDLSGVFLAQMTAGLSDLSFEQILTEANQRAMTGLGAQIMVSDLLWAVLALNPKIGNSLTRVSLDLDDLDNLIYWVQSREVDHKTVLTFAEKARYGKTSFAQGWSSGYTPVLDHFGHEVTGQGINFSTEGRGPVLDVIENTLSKDSKSNCLLVGPIGTGKSTLVRGLAKRIYWGQVVDGLAHLRVVQLDLPTLISSAKTPAEMEQLVTSIFNDAVRAGNVIVFIDDIHTVFSGGKKAGTTDISQIILPFLESSEVKIIGATTEGYFQTYIESKPGVASSFTKVPIEPTDSKSTLRILEAVSGYYSNKFHLSISYGALKEAYLLAERYTQGKEFPAKAVDLLADICQAARNQKIGRIDKQTVLALSSKVMMLPLEEAKGAEKETLLNLEETIHERMIGQDFAVKAVSDALRRVRTKTDNSKRPASFLFLGPTGVGKTELAKSLAAAYFGSEEEMIRMDMSEYQEVSSIKRFIGHKITGSEELEGGDLVKQIRSKPFSVVLLDEIEKAHPNIMDLFLQVLDEGYLTDGMGEKALFTNSIIIATSNAGSEQIRAAVNTASDYEKTKAIVLDQIQKSKTLRSEFLNRFDGVIVFNPLNGSEITRIAQLMFASIQSNFRLKGFQIEIEPDLLLRLAKEGYQPEFGARPMRRVFQDRIESFLAKKLLAEGLDRDKPLLIKVADIYGDTVV